MPANRKYSEEKIHLMLTAWRGGLRYKALGKKFGITSEAMGSLMRRYMNDEDKERMARSKTAQPDMVQETMDLWRTGMTYHFISEKVGYSQGVIAGIISRHKRKDETTSKIRDVKYSSFHHKKDSGGLGIMRLEIGQSSSKDEPRIFTGIHFSKCQWISGKPSRDDRCKCMAKTGEDRVYCPSHEVEAVRKDFETE